MGAPSLRFLQEPALGLPKGRVRCCLYHEIFGRVKIDAAGSIATHPRKARGWGTQLLGCADEIQGRATRLRISTHPPLQKRKDGELTVSKRERKSKAKESELPVNALSGV